MNDGLTIDWPGLDARRTWGLRRRLPLGVQQEAVMANDLWRLFARSLSSTLRWASALKRGLIGSQTAIGSANSADLAHRKTKEKVGIVAPSRLRAFAE